MFTSIAMVFATSIAFQVHWEGLFRQDDESATPLHLFPSNSDGLRLKMIYETRKLGEQEQQ